VPSTENSTYQANELFLLFIPPSQRS